MSPTERQSLLFVPGIVLSAFLFPICYVFGLHFKNSCKPSLIGYFILETCHKRKKSTLQNPESSMSILKILMFAANIATWLYASCAAVSVDSVVLILCIWFIRDSIQFFWKHLLQNRNCEETAKLYRQIQLWNILCNSVQQNCLGVLICVAICLVAMSLAMLIRNGKSNLQHGNIAFLIKVALIAVDALIVTLVLTGGMVQVYSESLKLQINIKRSNVMPATNKKWKRKFWKSCDKIKIKFGDHNYLEVLTPLKCLDCSLQLTVQVLLLE